MSPAGPGGRPRNAWNPSRQRKLVRLYTLTLLTKEEIQKVLEAPDFNPRSIHLNIGMTLSFVTIQTTSSSDIQKTESLFPSDYAKDHRKYRPSNDSNLELRSLTACGVVSEAAFPNRSDYTHALLPETRLESRPFGDHGQIWICLHGRLAHTLRDCAGESSYNIRIIKTQT